MPLSSSLVENIRTLHQLLPIDKSFDLIHRDLVIGSTAAYWIGVNGMCKTEVLQQIFSDLQNPLYTEQKPIEDLVSFMQSKIGFAQVETGDNWDSLLKNLVSGPTLLFVDGFDFCLVLDARTYPSRGIAEPDTERSTKGGKDGFVETLLSNANLIRRRIRSPKLIFSMHSLGTNSRTDVAVAYLEDTVNENLLQYLNHVLDSLQITSLTMGAQSLKELLVPHRWWNPLPSIQYTERPDVACSYLEEGHLLILVDNTPQVLILPCSIFQFTQSPEDYYKAPLVGSYFRLIRFLCIPVSLFLMPVFLLITGYFPQLSDKLNLVSTNTAGRVHLIFYVLAVEFILDLFKYSASLSPGRFSGALSIVGGLLIGDIAVNLNWASTEALFYGAISLLASLSLSSIEFADALRVYHIFLLLTAAFGGIYGFLAGTFLMLWSMLTTPTFGSMSYFWPLVPFNSKALGTLLLRHPTPAAQPAKYWDRGNIHENKHKKSG